ncbi:MAG: hypothetical protein IJB02_01450 [Oscillospiraceae bacterium]|nr:hypothetical protein [Oscillospiraceae bacterium]
MVCVSHAVKDRFSAFLPQYADKLAVYHNRFPVEEIQEMASIESPYSAGCFHIVTTARIDNLQKRIDGIVKLCARLRDEGVTGFSWHLVGGGPDLTGNQQLARELGVAELICFEGEKINPPWRNMAAAEQPSRGALCGQRRICQLFCVGRFYRPIAFSPEAFACIGCFHTKSFPV